MKKISEMVFVCSNCGNEFSKWSGQCLACGEWNSLKEVKNDRRSFRQGSTRGSTRTEKKEVVNLGSVEQVVGSSGEVTFSTQIGELDRVLGKGLVRGQVVLFAGEPGIGKSTLLTQLVGTLGGLYVAGEESVGQIGLRVERLGLEKKKFDILETNVVEGIEEIFGRTNNVYKIVVVDSIQMMSSESNQAMMGSVTQIRESTMRLIELAKRMGVVIIIVGHVTKEGDIAGPKLLEHMVDTVLYFEGDKNSELRILRATKNRFGPTDEVGIFTMSDVGLSGVRGDEINLTSGGETKVGSATTVIMEGTRPMVVEIQALVTESFAPVPKRVFSGIDYNRGQLLVAVAQKVLGMPLYKYDVFVAVTGGLRIDDTGADLAVVAAMYSSYRNLPLTKSPSSRSGGTPSPLKKGELKKGLVLIGEVSLLGEVKKVRNWERRVKEAKDLGREVAIINSIRELKR